MSSIVTVSIAALLVTLASGAGALALRRHRAYVFAFCSGALIGGAVILILPDARRLLEQAPSRISPDLVWPACALGFLFFYLFGRAESSHGATRLAGLGGALGLVTHSFLDGVVIGQGFQAGEQLGVSLAVAVLVHKLADGVSVIGIMLGTNYTTKEAAATLAVTAVAPVLGAMAQSVFVLPTAVLALMLGGFSGMFLYLGASRLLPEARRETSPRTVAALSLSGVAFAYLAHVLSH